MNFFFFSPKTMKGNCYLTFGFICGLFLLMLLSLVLWGYFPESRLPRAAAAIFTVWLAIAVCVAFSRFYHRFILPLEDIAKFTETLTRGEYPPTLRTLPGKNHQLAAIFKAMNLIRDRLQNVNSRLRNSVQREQNNLRNSESYQELRARVLAQLMPDLRIPLNAISGYGQLLTEQPESSHTAEWMTAIERNLNSAERMFNRLIDLSRLETGYDATPVKSVFVAHPFLRRVIEYNHATCAEYGAVLALAHDGEGMPELIAADREVLLTQLSCLVRAMASTVEHGERVEISCESAPPHCRFRVRDANGAERKLSLCELYHRYRDHALAEIPAKFELALLQLVFVETQAIRLSGSLTVTQHEGITELQLQIPVADPRENFTSVLGAAHFADSDAAHPPGAAEEWFRRGGELRRLLLIDEDPDFAAILRALFPAVELLNVASVEQAFALEDLADYDLALLGITPGRNERDIPEEEEFIRRATRLRLPVVAVKSDHSNFLRRHLEKAGACEIVTKPLDFAAFQETLTRIGGKSQSD